MAQRVQTLFVSDLSGDDLGQDGQTVKFSYRGTDYEIDLSQKEAAGFDKSIAMYLEHARKVGGSRRSGQGPSRAAKGELEKIRSWARENGHQVSDRGRVSKKVQDAYYATR